MTHTCHARGCKTPVKPELLMCLRHWRMVPPKLQRAVWSTYRPGQCDDKRPSREWHDAASAAIGYVALREGRKAQVTRGEVKALLVYDYEKLILDTWGREEAITKLIAELRAETATRR